MHRHATGSGRVYSAGSNSHGQLGIGGKPASQPHPATLIETYRVASLQHTSETDTSRGIGWVEYRASDVHVEAAACGLRHTLMVARVSQKIGPQIREGQEGCVAKGNAIQVVLACGSARKGQLGGG